MAIALDITQFRLDFPEFTSTTVYPDAQITFWATLAEAQLPKNIWGSIWTLATELYVAHEITLAAQNSQVATNGGMPGQNEGIPNSKTVGSVSVSYDATTTTEKDAGWWNMTNYGKQLFRLIKIYGAGCIQL